MWKMSQVLRDKKARRIATVTGAVYIILYLSSIGNIAISKFGRIFTIMFIENWSDLLFKQIAPFLWEPIALIHIAGGLIIRLSVPNLILALFLTLLVALNIAVAAYTYYIMPIRPGLKGLIALLPSLFTGFVCCVPSIIVTLGAVSASFTIFFIEIRQFLIPASILFLLINLYYSLKSLKPELMKIYEEEKTKKMNN